MKIGVNFAADNLKQNLVNAINESNVPAVIIRVTLEELLNQAKTLEAQYIENERREYAEALKAEQADARASEAMEAES